MLLIVAGHEGDSSVRHLMSEGMNTESAAELHLACFFWSLAVDEGSASTLAHLWFCDSQVPVAAPALVLIGPQAKKHFLSIWKMKTERWECVTFCHFSL